MIRIPTSFLVLLFLGIPAIAQVTVGGATLIPKELLFSVLDDRSRASGEGVLPGECKWTFLAETATAQSPQEECTAYFYRTTVTLARSCPHPKRPQSERSDRTVLAGRSCPSKSFEPQTAAKILSTGTNSDGKRQEIVVMPDGTRITIAWSPQDTRVHLRYPDGSADVLEINGQ